jgi:flagellar assembly factor FliW
VALGPCYGPYLGLRASLEGGPTFVVAQPSELGIELSVDIDDFHQSLLGLTEARQVLVLLIATLRGENSCPTVNTRAPLVINVENLRAAQIVQGDQAYRLDEPATVPFFDPARDSG